MLSFYIADIVLFSAIFVCFLGVVLSIQPYSKPCFDKITDGRATFFIRSVLKLLLIYSSII